MIEAMEAYEVGDYVFDHSYGLHGLVVETFASWKDDESGELHTWDYGILFEDGHIGYSDIGELKPAMEETERAFRKMWMNE